MAGQQSASASGTSTVLVLPFTQAMAEIACRMPLSRLE
jgi:hypothetical protein